MKTATLQEFYEESTKPSGRVLNLLDLPMGADINRQTLPRFE
jgi:hypothetical protein